jgi:hypothetical protein
MIPELHIDYDPDDYPDPGGGGETVEFGDATGHVIKVVN